MTQLVQAIVPDTESYQSPEAETASVYPLRDHDYHDPMMRMLRSALEESWEDDPDDSIIARTRLNISLLGHICLYAYMHKVNPNIFRYFL